MPTATQVLKVSPNDNYIITSGTYKPRIRCFDTANLALKWERYTDTDVLDLEILGDDWQKLVLLFNNRLLQFHNADGNFHQLRIPKFGRVLKFNRANCELYICGDGNEIYRFSLESGQFMEPFVSDISEGLNKLIINKETGLLMTGSKNGVVEAWDTRVRKSVAKFHSASDVLASFRDDIEADNYTEDNIDSLVQVTSIATKGALDLAVGYSTGHVMLYDIRSSTPYLEKDLRYGLPVKSIAFVKGGADSEDLVLSADERCAKLWSKYDGSPVCAIESEHKINDMHVFEGTGLVMFPVEQPKIQTYFVPHLGPAPKWCSFLDSLAEELEEENGTGLSGETAYDNYRFVTLDDLKQLGIESIVGTKLLRAYMHGYFMDQRLYDRVRSERASEQSLEHKRTDLINEKLEKSRESRIGLDQAKDIIDSETTKLAKSDDRFGNILSNPAFAIDQDDDDFKMRNPEKSAKRMRRVIRGEREDSSDEERDADLETDKGTWRENIKMTYKQVFDKKGAKQDVKKLIDNETVLTAKIKASGKDLQSVDTIAEVKEIVEKKDALIGDRIDNSKNQSTVTAGVTGDMEMNFKGDEDDLKKEKKLLNKERKNKKKLLKSGKTGEKDTSGKPKKKVEIRKRDSSRRTANFMLPNERKQPKK